jgi:hypothetical protein
VSGRDPVLFQDEKGNHYLMVFWPGDGWHCLKAQFDSKILITKDITESVIPPSARGDPPPKQPDMIFGILGCRPVRYSTCQACNGQGHISEPV